MTGTSRIYALLLVFLLVFLTPLSAHAEEGEDDAWEEEEIKPTKLYSFSYEEKNTQGLIHLHRSYAERGDVDLLDAFIETAGYGGSMYISIGDVKLYLSKKLVSQIAARGEPVTIYIMERTVETDESTGTGDTTKADAEDSDLLADTVYDIDLGFEFERESLKIRVKHKTNNVEGLRVLSIDEDGRETELKSAYAQSLVAFFPERTAFTLRITEEPPSEGASKILVLLSGGLFLLVALSVAALVLLRKGTLKRMYLRRYNGR